MITLISRHCSMRPRGGPRRFRLNLHVGDVGHTMIVGPTGAGKSVLLAMLALQFRRYEQSQVFHLRQGPFRPCRGPHDGWRCP